jgi:hypothetical protein
MDNERHTATLSPSPEGLDSNITAPRVDQYFPPQDIPRKRRVVTPVLVTSDILCACLCWGGALLLYFLYWGEGLTLSESIIYYMMGSTVLWVGLRALWLY